MRRLCFGLASLEDFNQWVSKIRVPHVSELECNVTKIGTKAARIQSVRRTQ